ncbi:hypothetical protein FK216_01050 [Moraxellaceae bacterium AER2_44_116]|nr:hypothetical protein [Moraxellaceae bacterium]TQC99860.1 hypothetical protein FK216_01050 [Moraxellaceae bacterium AER2_44_116]
MFINWSALKKHKAETPLLVVDLCVLFLISLNLLVLLVDSIVMNTGVGVLLAKHYPTDYLAYKNDWHKDLPLYDSLFTVFLLTELGLRWLFAIYKKTYHRWFFYPFIHWYDVIASLPGLQFLRLLRLITVTYRMHQLGILELGQTFTKTAQKYYAIIIEEVSDRIVLNVLDGVQKELSVNNPVAAKMRETVLVPHKEVITHWLANRISALTAVSYQKHEKELEAYLHQITANAIHDNQEWRNIKKRLPFVGGLIESELNSIVGGLVNSIAAKVLDDLSQPDNSALHDLADAAFETFTLSDAHLDKAMEQIVIEAIDIVKAQVAIQQWKVDELNEKAENLS